ncbi:hypothetical protein CP965_08760 [Halarcobacter mediterraneus]|uniref:Isochorismatase-like domain-containing protein n=2 Tax=Halarcobacter mediterraneus TaxID=2023153 RepID=A0A4Q1AXE9_9BACT|nr:hypothetical protein CP965_08760 [Halarcobacter mediterraneus]
MKKISLEKSALVLIEYQNEWLKEGTKLSNMMKDKKQFRNSIDNSKKVLSYATNVCVDSTMREAHDKGYNTTIISDATSSFTKEEQECFFRYIVHHFANEITTKKFLSLKAKVNKKKIVQNFLSI